VASEQPLEPVYLITGSDRPKIETAVARLRKRFAPEAVENVSALETTGEAAVALCNAGSLFGEARLVVVDDVDGRRDGDGRTRGGWKSGDVDAVAAYLQDPAPATVLALLAQEVKKTAALWKACAKAGDVLEYAVQKRDVQKWIAEQFRNRGVRAEPEACAALLQLVGENLNALSVEVDKIATWAAGEPVGEREVEAVTAASADTPTFMLTDAYAERDLAKSLAASEAIFERDAKPRRDTAARLTGALAGHVTRLRTLKGLASEGVSAKDAVFARGATRRGRPAGRPRRRSQGPEQAGARSRSPARARRPRGRDADAALAPRAGASGRGAGDDLCRLRLLARGGVAMEGATARGAVDGADELPVLARDEVGVARCDCGFEPLREGLDRGAVAQVLEALPRLDPHALLLLLDVRHSKRCPRGRGPRDGSRTRWENRLR
jgi:DNA polymerase III delta subunit